jgi:hypothetical protein
MEDGNCHVLFNPGMSECAFTGGYGCDNPPPGFDGWGKIGCGANPYYDCLYYPCLEWCFEDAKCEDDDPCTKDYCAWGGVCAHDLVGLQLYPLEGVSTVWDLQHGTTRPKDGWLAYAPDWFYYSIWAWPLHSRMTVWVGLPTIVLPCKTAALLTFRLSLVALGQLCPEAALSIVVNGVTAAEFVESDLGGFSYVPVQIPLGPWAGSPIAIRFVFDSHDCMAISAAEIHVDHVRVTVPDCSFPVDP